MTAFYIQNNEAFKFFCWQFSSQSESSVILLLVWRWLFFKDKQPVLELNRLSYITVFLTTVFSTSSGYFCAHCMVQWMQNLKNITSLKHEVCCLEKQRDFKYCYHSQQHCCFIFNKICSLFSTVFPKVCTEICLLFTENLVSNKFCIYSIYISGFQNFQMLCTVNY